MSAAARNEQAWREIAAFCEVPFAELPRPESRNIRNRWQAGRLPSMSKEWIMKNLNLSKRAAKRLVATFGVAAVLASVTELAGATGIDVSAVTGGISDAQTAIIAVITALLAMSTAIFGLAKVYSFVKRRAGA